MCLYGLYTNGESNACSLLKICSEDSSVRASICPIVRSFVGWLFCWLKRFSSKWVFRVLDRGSVTWVLTPNSNACEPRAVQTKNRRAFNGRQIFQPTQNKPLFNVCFCAGSPYGGWPCAACACLNDEARAERVKGRRVPAKRAKQRGWRGYWWCRRPPLLPLPLPASTIFSYFHSYL